MDVRNGIKRIFNLTSLLSGVYIVIYVLRDDFNAIEYRLKNGEILSTILSLCFCFVVGLLISFFSIKLIEKMFFYVYDGFFPKKSIEKKDSF